MKKIDIKIIAILGLTLLLGVQLFKKPKVVEVVSVKEVPVKADTIVKDSIVTETITEIEFVPTYVDRIQYVNKPFNVDTLQIITNYLAEINKVDTIYLKQKMGYAIISDIINKNNVKSRNVEWKLNLKPKTIEVMQPKQSQLYLGFGYQFDAVNRFSGTNLELLYKSPNDRMFGLTGGVRTNLQDAKTNSTILVPYLGGSIYIKLK